MKKNNIEIFPTLITVVNNFLTKSQCEDIVNFGKKIQEKHHYCIPENGISNHDKDYYFLNDVVINITSCNKIYEMLHEQINNYANEIGYENLQITNSWINYQYKNSVLLRHTHPNSVISAVLYLKVDDNSSKIHFYNPNSYVNFCKYERRNRYNFEYQWIKPFVGDLILFPSWLAHGSNNEKNESLERVVLSLNTKYQTQ